jgi:hypothetical protein
MKKLILLISAIATSFISIAQQSYSFNGKSNFNIGYTDGKIEQVSSNPKVSKIYEGEKCIQYVRSSNKFDNIKLHPKGYFEDVSGFATFHSSATKLKMKIYSTAPVGTLVEVQFTGKGIDNYPKGVHSQFQAKTKKQNEWEEVVFDFVNAPEGSEVKPFAVNEIVVLFAPNTTGSNTFYISEFVGPKVNEETSEK